MNGFIFPEIVGQGYEPFYYQSLTRENVEPAKIRMEGEQIKQKM